MTNDVVLEEERAGGVRWLVPSRVMTLALATFTQLARMKVFYLLLIFAVLLVGVNFLRFAELLGPEVRGIQELISLKSISMGAMQLFAVLFSIAATALLIPRDMEDRTLYTILCKPVPRIDYLIGKWLGVMILTGLCLGLMGGALAINLYFRTEVVVGEQIDQMARMGMDEESQLAFVEKIYQQGVTASLLRGLISIVLESGVMAAVALLISTLSSSTLFSLVASFGVYAVGLFQADARAVVLSKDASWLQEWLARLIAYLFPDLQFFGVVDATARGEYFPMVDFLKLVGISGVYAGIYLVLAWFLFSRKEF